MSSGNSKGLHYHLFAHGTLKKYALQQQHYCFYWLVHRRPRLTQKTTGLSMTGTLTSRFDIIESMVLISLRM